MAVSHAYGGTSAAPVQPGCTTAICLSDWSVSALILEPNLRPPGPTSHSTPASRAVTGGDPHLDAFPPTPRPLACLPRVGGFDPPCRVYYASSLRPRRALARAARDLVARGR